MKFKEMMVKEFVFEYSKLWSFGARSSSKCCLSGDFLLVLFGVSEYVVAFSGRHF